MLPYPLRQTRKVLDLSLRSLKLKVERKLLQLILIQILRAEMNFKQIYGLHATIMVARVLYQLKNCTFVGEIMVWFHF